MWDHYLDGSQSGKRACQLGWRTLTPARSKSEVTIFLVKNQGCEARVDAREPVQQVLIRQEKQDRMELGCRGTTKNTWIL